jgi:hypothetical protein
MYHHVKKTQITALKTSNLTSETGQFFEVYNCTQWFFDSALIVFSPLPNTQIWQFSHYEISKKMEPVDINKIKYPSNTGHIHNNNGGR